jgi:hypothetical protein
MIYKNIILHQESQCSVILFVCLPNKQKKKKKKKILWKKKKKRLMGKYMIHKMLFQIKIKQAYYKIIYVLSTYKVMHI